MDLAEWYAGGRWEGLLELIDQLPSACRLNEAIAQDDETAEYLLAAADEGENRPAWSPRVAEFDLQSSLLVSLINEVKTLRQSGVAVAGGKPKKERPFPTPQTALDRARERQDLDLFHEMEAMFGFGRK